MRTIKKGFARFLKAQAAAYIATICDFSITYICLQLLGIYYLISTTIGAVSGGLINCIINYNWAFSTNNVRMRYVLIKYFFVWFGSIIWNVTGVYFVKNLLQSYTPLWTYSQSLCVMVAKVIVAIIVAVCWNYTLHYFFVYRNLTLKRKHRLANNKN